PEWLQQMKEFRGVMGRLDMPWFPVAGNHDVYFRGPNRPERGHEGNYEKHFGPLWYYFQHKNAGFVVLYSDEGDLKRDVKGYNRPDLVQMSPKQLDFLSKSLAALKSLDHVFIFVHHPRWVEKWYRGSNWNEIHTRLKNAGNVSAVFAGHVHRMRYDGRRDGIEYFCLAATGASLPGVYPGAGYLHHMNVVTVRKNSYSVSTIPVGAVLDPKQFTPKRQDDVDLLRRSAPIEHIGKIELGASGAGTGQYGFRFKNPTDRPIEVRATPEYDARTWILDPDHQHVKIAPGKTHEFKFVYARKEDQYRNWFAPRLDVQVDYLEDAARIAVPEKNVAIPVTLKGKPPADDSARAGYLDVAAKNSCVRIDSASFQVPEGPITVECRLRTKNLKGTPSCIGKTELSGFAIELDKGHVKWAIHLGERYVTAKAPKPLEADRWYHVAGVYEEGSVRLYLDGKLVAQEEGFGPMTPNDKPLFIGAEPRNDGSPNRYFGGQVDGLRLSRVARYKGNAFDVRARHEPDADTVLLFKLDRNYGPFVLDRSGSNAHGMIMGSARCVPEEIR
ncbi:MAG: LamG-like jellyroll fold domain-containing protein, partial [Planctomycetota bacterium]